VRCLIIKIGNELNIFSLTKIAYASKTVILTLVGSFLILRFLILYKIKSKKREAFKNSGISIVDKMNGQEFEEFLLLHFKNLGYKGHTTATTNDYGADLILNKDHEKIVIQAKRWSKKVGIEAVQQIVGARDYYKATKCIVMTNNYFTPNAINLAERSKVELWDRKKLLNIMSKANGKEILESNFTVEKVEKIKRRHICEKCGGDMVVKNGQYGRFYGCNNYPKCNYTEKY
jgi:restriction system protein